MREVSTNSWQTRVELTKQVGSLLCVWKWFSSLKKFRRIPNGCRFKNNNHGIRERPSCWGTSGYFPNPLTTPCRPLEIFTLYKYWGRGTYGSLETEMLSWNISNRKTFGDHHQINRSSSSFTLHTLDTCRTAKRVGELPLRARYIFYWLFAMRDYCHANELVLKMKKTSVSTFFWVVHQPSRVNLP